MGKRANGQGAVYAARVSRATFPSDSGQLPHDHGNLNADPPGNGPARD
jgi:hypothetical protein